MVNDIVKVTPWKTYHCMGCGKNEKQEIVELSYFLFKHLNCEKYIEIQIKTRPAGG